MPKYSDILYIEIRASRQQVDEFNSLLVHSNLTLIQFFAIMLRFACIKQSRNICAIPARIDILFKESFYSYAEKKLIFVVSCNYFL